MEDADELKSVKPVHWAVSTQLYFFDKDQNQGYIHHCQES